jgi:hypothetical protein
MIDIRRRTILTQPLFRFPKNPQICPPNLRQKTDRFPKRPSFLSQHDCTISGPRPSGDHPENNLAKFGYIPYMKVKINKNEGSFYILSYLMEHINEIWRLKIMAIGNIW